jgi:hypothetical protein
MAPASASARKAGCGRPKSQGGVLSLMEPDRALVNSNRYPIEAIRTALASRAVHFRGGLRFRRNKLRPERWIF